MDDRQVFCDDPNLAVKPEAVEEGRQYRLTLNYRSGCPAGSIQRKVIVEKDDAKQPRIEIPVVASVLPVGEVGR